MSSEIDDRIVAMKFENKTFESGVSSTLNSLARLKEAMNFSSVSSAAQKSMGFFSSVLSRFNIKNPFSSAQRGVEELQNQTGRFSLSTMEGGITSVSKSFIAMSTVAITALSNIVNKAVDSGLQLAKAFTIDPVKAGLKEYEDTLDATQTLMSGTGESVEQVTKTLKDLNDYSDRTIYAFSDMTDNITAFTNAGLSSEKSAEIMKGIANAAADAGISATQAAAAMRGFGQSMSMGYVGLQDWNQVDNAQLATKGFKEELIKSGLAAGTLTKAMDGTIKTNKGTEVTFKNLRSTLQDQWLSSDVLTNTLQKYSDTSTVVGKRAAANAQRVKTLSQAMGILKESAQSGWSQTWQLLFGNLEEATELWTSFNDTIGGMIQASAESRNALIGDWKELGGRALLIEGVKDVFYALMDVVSPIKKAFRDIFPAQTGQTLFALTEKFAAFAENLSLGETTMDNVRRTFRGVFAIFEIGLTIIGDIASGFGILFDSLGGGQGDFLEFTGTVGDLLVAFSDMVSESGFIAAFFEGLANVIAVPIELIGRFANYVADLFTGFDPGTAGKFTDALGTVSDRLSPLEQVARTVSRLFGRVGEAIANAGPIITEAMSGIGDAIANAFTGDAFGRVLDVINTGLLAGIVLMLKNFFSGFSVDLGGSGGGFIKSITDTFDSLTDTLSVMQGSIKADILLKIAGALAIMTAAIVVLAMINPKDLAKALSVMALGFLGMQAALVSLNAAVGIIGAAKLPFIAGALILLATAMLIFSAAVKSFAEMNLGDMARGMLGIAIMLKLIQAAVVPLSKNASGMITAGIGLIAVATALKIMASAVKDFAEMDYSTMARGLVGVAGTLVILAGAMRIMPKGILIQAVAMVILAGALRVLAVAVGEFAEMDYKTIARGLVGVVGSLGGIALAMRLMPKNMLIQAAALVIVASALGTIQAAVAKFGDMTMEQIATGLIAMGGALVILAAGLYLMNGSLAGAAALTIAAGALAILTPILITLGSLSMETIAKGLGTLAGALLILAAAAYLMGGASVVLLAIGGAIALIGLGFALAGAGALAFAAAFGIVVGAGAAGIAILSGVLGVIIKAIPKAVRAFAAGFIEFIKTIGAAGPEMVSSFSKIIGSILDAVIKNIPKLVKLFNTMMMNALRVIVVWSPKIFALGLDLIIGFLRAVDSRIGEIVDLAASIIIKFMEGLGRNMPKIVDAGYKMIIKFLEGLAKAIRENSEEMGRAGGDLAAAMVEGMVKGLAGGAGAIKDAAMAAAKAAWESVKDFFKIKSPSRLMAELGKYVSEGFAVGITEGEGSAVLAMETMGTKIKDAATEAVDEVEKQTARLKELQKEKDKDEKAIAKAKKRVDEAKEQRKLTEDAHRAWMKGSKEERKEMALRGKEYDALLAKIEEEQDALQELIDAKASYESGITSQFSGLPDIDKETDPEAYAKSLEDQAAATEKFLADLETLRSLGMDEATYQKLLDEGLDAQPFVTRLIAGGADMVEAIDANTARLNAAAAALGAQAASNFHDAGIQAQQGLVNGLLEDKTELESAMAELAKKMIKALRKALKIKSPSREFAVIGKYSNEGLAKGLDDYSDVAANAAAGVGTKALDTLRVSMSKVGDAVGGNLDFQPVIAPVLDLSQMAREANKISGMLDTGVITPSMSFNQASELAAAVDAAKDAAESVKPEVREIKIEQTNNSPKPLDPTTHYRNTKSAFALVKEALDS